MIKKIGIAVLAGSLLVGGFVLQAGAQAVPPASSTDQTCPSGMVMMPATAGGPAHCILDQYASKAGVLVGWPPGGAPVDIGGCPVISLSANACSIDGGQTIIGCNNIRECDSLTGDFHCEWPLPFPTGNMTFDPTTNSYVPMAQCSATKGPYTPPPLGMASPGCSNAQALAAYPGLCSATSVDSPNGGGPVAPGGSSPSNTGVGTGIPAPSGGSGTGVKVGGSPFQSTINTTLGGALSGPLSGWSQILSTFNSTAGSGQGSAGVAGSAGYTTTGSGGSGSSTTGGTSGSASASGSGGGTCLSTAASTISSSLQTLQGISSVLTSSNVSPGVLTSIQNLINAVALVITALAKCIGG